MRFHMFSVELPPMLAFGGSRVERVMDVVCSEFGCTSENGLEVARLKQLQTFPVMVWLAVTATTSKPSRSLLQALLAYTPRSAIDLLLELADAETAYKRRRPLIPPRRLYAASRVLRGILRLHGYPVEV